MLSWECEERAEMDGSKEMTRLQKYIVGGCFVAVLAMVAWSTSNSAKMNRDFYRSLEETAQEEMIGAFSVQDTLYVTPADGRDYSLIRQPSEGDTTRYILP